MAIAALTAFHAHSPMTLASAYVVLGLLSVAAFIVNSRQPAPAASIPASGV
jgi:hypothetical protein